MADQLPGIAGSDPPFAGDPPPDHGVFGQSAPPDFSGGEEVPLDATDKKPGGSSGGTSTGTSVELNFFGDFPNPWQGNIKTEMAQLKAKKWFPGTIDFKGVAGGTGTTISNVWAFLIEILKAPKPIKRLNFFSHGLVGFFSTKGTIDPSGKSVSFDGSADTQWTQIFGKTKAIMDPYAKTWGDTGGEPDIVLTVEKTDITLSKVRAKFTSDAVIWLYTCNGANDQMAVQQFANIFQVTTKGFTKEVVFCVADEAMLKSRKHDITINTETDAEASCNKKKESDFHNLDTLSVPPLRTMTPKK